MNDSRKILCGNAQWRRLTTKALRALSSSPRQQAIIAEYKALERKLLGAQGPSIEKTDWRMVAIGLGAYTAMPRSRREKIRQKLLDFGATEQQATATLTELSRNGH